MRKLFITCLILVNLFNIYGSGIEQFELKLGKDIAIGATAVTAFTTGSILRFYSDPDANEFGWFDEDFTFEYNEDVDFLCDMLFFSPLLAVPLLMDEYSFESVSTLCVIGAETGFLVYGIKYILKSIIQRPRPYNSYSSTPQSLLDDLDRNYSFPSGHTATAFSCASFCTYIYSQGDGTKFQKRAMGVSTYSVAALTGALRIYSGNHYLTDVLAGAALGTSVGLLVPYLHKNMPDNITPVLSYNFAGLSMLM